MPQFGQPNSKLANQSLLTSHWGWYAGLGNVMFQQASIIGLALKFDRLAVIENHKDFINNYIVGSTVPIGLYKYFELSALPILEPQPYWIDLFQKCITCIDNDLFNVLATSKIDNFKINGLLQTYKYFDDFKHLIKNRYFKFKSTIRQMAETKIHQILTNHNCTTNADQKRDCLIIGVHVRRGDKTSAMWRDMGFNVADKDYIRRAVRWYQNKYGQNNKLIFVFVGNEYKWSKENIGHIKGLNLLYLRPGPIAEDLCILTLCDHLIITVGTYGWWASYLGKGDVVYYKDLYRPFSAAYNSTSYDDIFLPTWTPL